MVVFRRVKAAFSGAWDGLRYGFRSVTEVTAKIDKYKQPGSDDPEQKLIALVQKRREGIQKAINKLKQEAAERGAPLFEPKDAWKVAKPMPGVLPDDPDKTLALDTALEDLSGLNGWATSNSLFVEGLAFLGYPYLAQLSQRPEYRVISETWAQEMTRKWVRLTASSKGDDSAEDKSEKITAIEAEMKRLKVKDLFKRAAELDGFFGRGHIYVDLKDAEEDTEELKSSIGDGRDRISKTKIRRGSIKGFRVVEPVWTYPNRYNSSDPLKSNFYEAQTWFVMGKEVHNTRLMTFIGRPMPDLLKPMYSFGGLSLSQMAKPYVDNWLRTRQSVSDAISNFSIMVLLTDLSNMLTDGAAVDAVDRADLFNTTRDNRGLMLADKATEQLENVAMPLSGLHELQAQSQEHMSSVSQIPLVKLTGISPSGLNASSEGEIKVFYDKINAQQTTLFSDNLTKVISLIQLNLFGEVDPEIGFEWEPLDTLDPAAEATRRKTEADTDTVLIDHGVLRPEEVRRKMAADRTSPYSSLDADDVPPVEEEETPGAETEGDRPLMDGLIGDKLPRAAGVLFVSQDAGEPRVLLLRRSPDSARHPGAWDLPGGGAEPGESPAETAAREALEETGQSVDIDPENIPMETDDSLGVLYATFALSAPAPFEPLLSDEHDRFGWFSLDDLPEGTLEPLKALLKTLNRKGTQA